MIWEAKINKLELQSWTLQILSKDPHVIHLHTARCCIATNSSAKHSVKFSRNRSFRENTKNTYISEYFLTKERIGRTKQSISKREEKTTITITFNKLRPDYVLKQLILQSITSHLKQSCYLTKWKQYMKVTSTVAPQQSWQIQVTTCVTVSTKLHPTEKTALTAVRFLQASVSSLS